MTETGGLRKVFGGGGGRFVNRAYGSVARVDGLR